MNPKNFLTISREKNVKSCKSAIFSQSQRKFVWKFLKISENTFQNVSQKKEKSDFFFLIFVFLGE